MPTRVYIVEDHALVRDILRKFVTAMDGFEVAGTAGSAEEALAVLQGLEVDLLLVDVSLPGRSGLDLLEEVRARRETPCVVLSGHREESYVSRALASGARGYVLKGAPEEIEVALRRVVAGERYLSPSLVVSDPPEGT